MIRGCRCEVGVARSRRLAEPTLPADTAPIADQAPMRVNVVHYRKTMRAVLGA